MCGNNGLFISADGQLRGVAADRPYVLFEVVRDAVALLGALCVAPAVECTDQIAGDPANPLEADALADAFFLFLLHGAPSFFAAAGCGRFPDPWCGFGFCNHSNRGTVPLTGLRENFSKSFVRQHPVRGLYLANRCVIIMVSNPSPKGGTENVSVAAGYSLYLRRSFDVGR